MGGIAKSISKAFKKVTNAATLGLLNQPNIPAASDAPVAAVPVETPNVENVDTTDQDTESNRKRARASGKKSLSVSRSTGNGVNI